MRTSKDLDEIMEYLSEYCRDFKYSVDKLLSVPLQSLHQTVKSIQANVCGKLKKAGRIMKYSKDEIIQYVQEEDVKFIRLAFCDVFGKQKNISIMPQELPRAFEYGIAIDASAIAGLGMNAFRTYPSSEPDTLMPLPWRPEHGCVVRMFCSITYPDGRIFECDTRSILKKAIQAAEYAGYQFFFGAEQEFYLFQLDDNGNPTKLPYDNAAYMDIAPEDRGENIRREICLTLDANGNSAGKFPS